VHTGSTVAPELDLGDFLTLVWHPQCRLPTMSSSTFWPCESSWRCCVPTWLKKERAERPTHRFIPPLAVFFNEYQFRPSNDADAHPFFVIRTQMPCGLVDVAIPSKRVHARARTVADSRTFSIDLWINIALWILEWIPAVITSLLSWLLPRDTMARSSHVVSRWIISKSEGAM
jgi:uncharacterized membrane protein YqaE (UPF0057 family)